MAISKRLTCAWQVRAISSALALYSMANTALAIISPALGPGVGVKTFHHPG
jgi:hypothetical protein